MTERLFWHNPYQQTFSARVVRRLEWQGRPAVVLDATCFYPTSGGQPNDTGQLGGVAVLDVIEADDEIVHVLAAPLPDEHVTGAITWERRLDHMQQHAGQHILSAAFVRVFGAQTVSFHLGPEFCTIDLDRATLTAEEAEEAEELANRVVLEARPIEVAQYDPEGLRMVPLRKPPQVEGVVRVVSIVDWDHSACGGTHPRNTGEVGAIHIERWEGHQGQVRVSFLCGLRALRDYRRKSRILRELANRLSVGMEELPAALERLETAGDEARRRAARLQAKVLALQAPALAAEAEQAGGLRILCRLLEDTDPAGMRQLAQQLTQAPGMVVALGVVEPSPQFCLARSADVVLDMQRLAAELAAPYGGRGGGRPHFVQGGGLSQEGLAAMLRDAQARLRRESPQPRSGGNGT